MWLCWKGELVSELTALAGFQPGQFSSLILHKEQRSDGVGKESCPGAGESDFHFIEKKVVLACRVVCLQECTPLVINKLTMHCKHCIHHADLL